MAWMVGLGLALATAPGFAQSEPAQSEPAQGAPVQSEMLPGSLRPAVGFSGASSDRVGVTGLITPALPSLREFDRYMPQDTRINLLLKLEHRKVYVFAGQKLLASFPVAIGRPGFPTPTGEFEVFEMITNPSWKNPWTGEVETPGADGSLGLRWIGFTEMSNGVIGFHGTPNVASIGQAASHGCVRMRNEDVVRLYDLVQIGTPVRVEP
jgi:hypothetical protein